MKSSEAEEFRAFHHRALQAVPFNAYKWETPVLDQDRWERDFEFVVLDASRLDRRQKPAAFQKHFSEADSSQECLEFLNLGKNAVMVVPTPQDLKAKKANYCHLGSFLNTCSLGQPIEVLTFLAVSENVKAEVVIEGRYVWSSVVLTLHAKRIRGDCS